MCHAIAWTLGPFVIANWRPWSCQLSSYSVPHSWAHLVWCLLILTPHGVVSLSLESWHHPSIDCSQFIGQYMWTPPVFNPIVLDYQSSPHHHIFPPPICVILTWPLPLTLSVHSIGASQTLHRRQWAMYCKKEEGYIDTYNDTVQHLLHHQLSKISKQKEGYECQWKWRYSACFPSLCPTSCSQGWCTQQWWQQWQHPRVQPRADWSEQWWMPWRQSGQSWRWQWRTWWVQD